MPIFGKILVTADINVLQSKVLHGSAKGYYFSCMITISADLLINSKQKKLKILGGNKEITADLTFLIKYIYYLLNLYINR